ncbi:MAG: DUF4277 domain-containing protein, partial [Chloroflexi bacterium]|nr:DUF4277 domain-containing protein [Chloroflexota bacterium]
MVLDVRGTLCYAGCVRVQTPHGPIELQAYSCQLPSAFAVVLPIVRRIGVGRVVDLLCPVAAQALLTHGQVVEFLILHILNSQLRAPLYKLDLWAAQNSIEL